MLPNAVYALQSEASLAETNDSVGSQAVATDIAAGSLSGALNQLAQVTGVALSYEPALTVGKTTQGVKAGVTLQQALHQLLVGSGIQYSRSGKTVTLVAKRVVLTLAPIRIAGTTPRRYEAKEASSVTGHASLLLDTPRSIQVIPEQVMLDQQAIDLEDVLKNVSGVQPYRVVGGTGESYILRGFRVNTVYQDGVRLNLSGRRVAVANLEQIEVVKGSTALLYGETEPGGVINVITKKPSAERRNYISTTVDDVGRRFALGDFTGSLYKESSLLYRLVASYENSETFREAGSAADVKRFNIAPSLSWDITDHDKLIASVELTSSEIPLDRGNVVVLDSQGIPSIADIPRERRLGEDIDISDNRQLNIHLDYQHRFSHDWNSQSLIHYENYENRSFQHNPAFGLTGLVAPNLGLIGNLLLSGGAIAQFSGVPVESGLLARQRFIADTEGRNLFFAQRFFGEITLFGLANHISFGVDFRKSNDDFISEQDLISINNIGIPLAFLPFSVQTQFRDFSVLNIYDPQYTNATVETTPTFFLNRRNQQLGYYAQDLITLNEQWQLSLGLRFDQIKNETETTTLFDSIPGTNGIAVIPNTTTNEQKSDTGSEVSPNGGVIFQPNENVSLYVSYSESFQGEFESTANDGRLNKFIVSEGVQYETGVKGSLLNEALNFNISVYDLTLENVLNGTNSFTGEREFNGEQNARGIEVDVNMQFLEGWNIIYSYAYTDAEITESVINKGNQPQGIAEHSASLWASYEFTQGSLHGLGIGFGAYYTGDRFADGANAIKLDSFTTTELSAWYYLPVANDKQVRFHLGVKNLTDKEYYIPGTNNFRIGLGNPRTVFASVALDF